MDCWAVKWSNNRGSPRQTGHRQDGPAVSPNGRRGGQQPFETRWGASRWREGVGVCYGVLDEDIWRKKQSNLGLKEFHIVEGVQLSSENHISFVFEATVLILQVLAS